MRSFIVEHQDAPQKERLHNDEGCHLEMGQAMMLVGQRETGPPSEVPRQSMSNERVDIKMSS